MSRTNIETARQFAPPDILINSIQQALGHYKLDLSQSKKLAQDILKLSDFFIHFPQGQTPWQEAWAQTAYLSYYLPLNSSRLRALSIEGAERGFFSDLDQVVDFGAGLATASLVLKEFLPQADFHLIEHSQEPQQIISNYFGYLGRHQWHAHVPQLKNLQKTLAVFSYSLTELAALPDWAYECEALMLVEPSTQQDGRNLMALRQQLIDRGFSIWAPCTHQNPCPLLTQSKNDWCHDRIHFKAPDWFTQIEQNLPMKNRTLTMSYILARKRTAPPLSAARLVGDLLHEKGKDRQMICRGSEREFLAWMHKNKNSQELPRGILVNLPADLQKVSNELRVHSKVGHYEP